MNYNKKNCNVAGKCGGCQLLNLTYDKQLSYKQVKVIKLLGNYHHVNEIIGMDNPYHYRNKIQAAFGQTRSDKIISGVYQSSTHKIVAIDECMIEDERADKIIVTIRKLLKDFKLTAFNEYNNQGFLRHILIRVGKTSGEIMVVLVTTTQIFPGKNNFVKELLKIHPEITTIVQNVNDKFTSMVLGDFQKVLYGDGYIKDFLCDLTFRISPKSFYQINPVQTEILYNTAMDYADLHNNETVIDAYSGIGTIGMIASKNAGKVICVENNKDAVKDAKINSKINNISNIEFNCLDSGEFMLKCVDENIKINTVFTDPPRAGCSKDFLFALCKLAPEKVIYISCNPETQARDLKYLVKNGYKVKKIQPVDMFPHTNHVETVVLMSRNKE